MPAAVFMLAQARQEELVERSGAHGGSAGLRQLVGKAFSVILPDGLGGPCLVVQMGQRGRAKMPQAAPTKAHCDEPESPICFDGDGARAQAKQDRPWRLFAVQEIRRAVMKYALGTGTGRKPGRKGRIALPAPVAVDKRAQLSGRAKMPAL